MSKTEVNKYHSQIEQARAKRKELLKELHMISCELELTIKKMKGETFYKLDFEQMNEFPLGQWVVINEQTKTMKIHSKEGVMIFQCQMIGGGGFGWHIHSDCTEEIYVIRGTLKDALNGGTYTQGESVFYEEGEEHLPVALELTELEVTFRKT